MPLITSSESKVCLIGKALILSAEFYDMNDTLTDPSIVKFILYDYNWKKISETVLNNTYRTGLGKYAYTLIPTEPTVGKYFNYEWYGEIGGLPSIERKKIYPVMTRD